MTIQVTPDTTRAELDETIALLCRDAKAMSRRGRAWDGDPAWERVHELINEKLAERDLMSA